eukprot:GHRQ01027330.1.p1 GENE.GHRQ01027330.1~~GHRQ01027330.1.p1  ORF type:complete len:167 (+),score=34.68 GHRQ01027330.1:77-502(+)
MAAANVTAAAARSQRLMQLQPLTVQAQSEHLVPLKQVAGMSSSALANARQMVGLTDPFTLAATTETLRWGNNACVLSQVACKLPCKLHTALARVLLSDHFCRVIAMRMHKTTLYCHWSMQTRSCSEWTLKASLSTDSMPAY